MESFVEFVLTFSHFSSTAYTAAMAKRAQEGSGEERVTAKSRPMMNLTARMPSVVLSSTSSNPGKTSYGYQHHGKSVASDDQLGKPEQNSWDSLERVDPHREEYLLGRTAHSARYEETIHDGTGQPVSENLQGKAHFENFIMGSEITEFVNKVRDQVRIRQKRMSSIAENCAEHSII